MKKMLVLAMVLYSLPFAFFNWNWIHQVFDQDVKAISSSVNAQVTINGCSEEAFQELQRMGPNLFGAEVKVEKVVNGISAQANSFAQIYLPAATVK